MASTLKIDTVTTPDGTGNITFSRPIVADGAALTNLPASFSPSVVHLHTTNGYGSTNNKIRRWSTVISNTGSDITYVDSASLGGTFTINTNGIYSMSYSDHFSVANEYGFSRNSNQLTTGISSITVAHALFWDSTPASNTTQGISITLSLSSGDVIRAHALGASGVAPVQTRFSISRVE